MSEMDEWTPDERKAYRRAEKACEAIQAEIKVTHFACWRLELKHPELYLAIDDDGPPGPAPGWRPSKLN
jgi:hypothetical protein